MARRCVPWVLAFVLLPFTMAIDNGVGLTPPSKLEGLFHNQTHKPCTILLYQTYSTPQRSLGTNASHEKL